MRKHFFNTSYFKSVDSPEKAYWLGFIAADGSISLNKGYALSIVLSTVDYEHLCCFAKDLHYPPESILLRKDNKAHRINLYSKKLVCDLMDIGINPKKTWSCKPWTGPSYLMPHYWRGVFDGDGCIQKSFKKRKSVSDYETWSCGLCGTYDMVKGFSEFIKSVCPGPYNQGTPKPHSSIWNVTFGGIRPCQEVVSCLYDNSNPALKRKLELAKEVLQRSLVDPIISHMTEEQLLPLYETLGNWSKVARQVGVSHNGMHKHIRKLGLDRRKWGKYGNELKEVS